MARTNKWIQFLKSYADNNDITYNQAMKDPKAKTLYTRQKSKGGDGLFDWFKSDNPEPEPIGKHTFVPEQKKEVGFLDWVKSLSPNQPTSTTDQGFALNKKQKKEYEKNHEKQFKKNQKNEKAQLEASDNFFNTFMKDTQTKIQSKAEVKAEYQAKKEQSMSKWKDNYEKVLENDRQKAVETQFANDQDYHHLDSKKKYDSKNPPEYYGYGFTESINFIKGEFGYTQKCKEILNKFGDIKITSAEVIRKPIEKIWNNVLSSISPNYKSQLKKQSYDELYHLCIVFTLVNGKRIMIEKNAVIQMTVNPQPIKDSESIIINTLPNININQIMKASHDKVGSSAFFRYSAQKYNCQHFIFNLLKNSNISSPELEQFIMQSVDKLFNPTLSKFSRNLTDIGAVGTMLSDN